MSFKSRLTRLQSGTTPETPLVESNTLGHRMAAIGRHRLIGSTTAGKTTCSDHRLARLVKGDVLSRGLIRIDDSFPLGTKNGGNLNAIHWIPPLPGESDQKPCIYIDTETTGLSGGSGTLAFLVGMAYMEKQLLQLTQFLITSFSAETEMLTAIDNTLPAGYRLASYNGKSFDMPLLQTRFRLHQIKTRLFEKDHLDLLHPVRRLYKNRWNDCRLVTAERQLLGFHRQSDLPGSEAPDAWFDFMRYGKTHKLVRTVEHNRQDILSLLQIHHALAFGLTEPDPDRMDITALARWLAPYDPHQARQLLQKHHDRLCNEGKLLLAKMLINHGDGEGALAIWETLAQHGCQVSLERLAIYHEHRSKNLAAALAYCRSMNSTSNRDYRLRRLCSKMSKQSAPQNVQDLIGNSAAESVVDPQG